MNLQTVISNWDIAQSIGIIAYFIGISAFLQKSDKRLKIHLGLSSLVIGLHYFLLGQTPAAISCMISTIRTWTSIYIRKTWLLFIFIILIWLLGVPTVSEPVHWLAIIGTTTGTIGLFCFTGNKLRLCLFFGSFLWCIHNYVVGSIGGLLQEGTFIIANLFTIIKTHQKN